MKLRHFLISVFFALALGPLALLLLWPQSTIFKSEIDEVYDRHLLIAQNLAAALTRYHRDLVTTFELFANDPSHWQMMEGTSDILANLSFQNICVADTASGTVTSSLVLNENVCANVISEGEMAVFTSLVQPGVTTVSEVMADANGRNVLHLLVKKDDQIVVGTIDTSYFQELGAAISFGIKGHAAIVDHQGNALSHPLPNWVAQRKDMSKISAVQRMMNAETGVEQFYSPALKGQMIAGFTSVEPVGWGVMIPQPVAELQAKATAALKSIIVVLLFGVAIALGLAVWVSILVARPLEWVNNQTQRVADGDLSLQPEIGGTRFLPVEFQSVHRNVRDMIFRLYQSAKEVNRLAYLDPLTGLANRASFRRKLKASTGEGEELESGALLFIDLDHFKEVNDSHGHDLGDATLKIIAERICDVCGISMLENTTVRHAMMNKFPDREFCARLGGDEFAVFLPNRTAVAGFETAEKLIECLSKPINLGNCDVTVGASIGIAQYPDHGQDGEDLLKASDLAMYEAKAIGKGRAAIFETEFLVRHLARNDFGAELLTAIECEQLEPYFQPQFRAADLSLCGVECLVRWNHPVRGLLGPSDFLPLARQLGLAAQIDEMMLQRSIKTVLDLWQRGLEVPSLAVNISPERLTSETILEEATVCAQLPFDLKFELLETVFLDDIGENMAGIIRKLHEIGVLIEMDDFGSGHSSVVALLNLRPDTLKIDRRLVAKLSQEEFGTAMVQAIVNLGKGTGIKVTAEGVETEEQLQILRSIGCDTLQGYYLGHPMTADALFDSFPRKNEKASTG